MTDRFILDESGNPKAEPNWLRWGNWMETADRSVARDEIDGVRVSTVFLGLDHQFGEGEPLLFETTIFGGPHDQWQERYGTRDAALAGHQRAVFIVRETTRPMNDGVFLPVGTVLTLIVVRDSVWVNQVVAAADFDGWADLPAPLPKPDGVAP